MGEETVLLGLHQIGRQDEDAVGAARLGGARELHRHRRAVADSGDDRDPPGGDGGRPRATTRLTSSRVSEKNSPVPPATKEPGRTMGEIGLDIGAVGCLVEAAVGPEMGDRKGQQPAAERALHRFRGHRPLLIAVVSSGVLVRSSYNKTTCCRTCQPMRRCPHDKASSRQGTGLPASPFPSLCRV